LRRAALPFRSLFVSPLLHLVSDHRNLSFTILFLVSPHPHHDFISLYVYHPQRPLQIGQLYYNFSRSSCHFSADLFSPLPSNFHWSSRCGMKVPSSSSISRDVLLHQL
jgi:hypothetical protein